MKRLLVLVALVGIGLVCRGCLLISVNKEVTPPRPQVVYVPTTGPAGLATASDLEARVQAANQIIDFTQRDKAMVKIAIDAANAGQPGVVQQALGKITDFTVRDKAAESCALALAGRGMRQEALTVAQTITDFTVKDRTLAKLASN